MNKKNAHLPEEKVSATDKRDSTTPTHDPLQGWYGLAANVKPIRTDRTQKRAWKRGKRAGQGFADDRLLFAVALLMIVAGKLLEGWV